jgi:hypothetical protein
MSFEEKEERAIANLKKEVLKNIDDNYNYQLVEPWLQIDAGDEFGYMYKKSFVDEFGDYVKEDFGNLLYDLGNTLAFTMSAYMKTHPKSNKIKFLAFMKEYLDLQFNDFGNWAQKLYDELPESDNEESEQPQTQEDNPS